MQRHLDRVKKWDRGIRNHASPNTEIIPDPIPVQPNVISVFTPKDLQDITSQLTSLISTVATLKQTVEQLSNRSNDEELLLVNRRLSILENSLSSLAQPQSEVEDLPLNSDFTVESALDDTRRVYLPYCCDISHVGNSNSCVLDGSNLELVVECDIRDTDIIIYPFGTKTDLPQFTENFEVAFDIKDSGVITGICYGTLQKDNSGIYSFHINDIYFTEGELSDCRLPLILSCEVDLPIE